MAGGLIFGRVSELGGFKFQLKVGVSNRWRFFPVDGVRRRLNEMSGSIRFSGITVERCCGGRELPAMASRLWPSSCAFAACSRVLCFA